MDKIRVLLVDDQRLFVESLCTLIRRYSRDIEVVGIATDGKQALDLLEELDPQVVLMDIRMPGMDGVQTTRILLEKFPRLNIMVLSTFDEDEYVREALHYGARGYLLKDLSPTELIASIRAINQGLVQISPSVAEKLVEELYEKHTNSSQRIPWFNTLGKREKEVLKLISKGYDNYQISQTLYISEQTVRNYVSSIYTKLGVNNRFEIIRLANEIK